jgi:hypothetical protein
MELRTHVAVELFVFLGLCLFLAPYSALVVAVAHFVPSIDYLMLKLSFGGRLHRKLFHNIFAGACVFFAVSLLSSPFLGALCFANVLLHFALDLPGKGIAVFYPLSDYRLRL